MIPSKKIGWALVTVALLTATEVAAASNLDAQIPDNAVMAFVAPSLSRLSDKIALVNQKLALNQPQMNNVLGLVKVMSGLNEGLDDRGGAAFVLTSLSLPRPDGTQPTPKFLIILSINDFDGFLRNFGQEPGGEITEVSIAGRTIYVKNAGNFVIAAPEREQVEAHRPGGNVQTRAGEFGRQILTHSDIVVYANLRHLSRIILPTLGPQMAQMKVGLEQVGTVNPRAEQFFSAYLDIYFDVMKAYMRDGDVMIMGVDISPNGFGFTYACTFKPGSPLALMFDKNPAHAPALDRLPDGRWVAAMTFDGSTLPIAEWVGTIRDSFPDDNPFTALLDGSQGLIESMDGGQWQSVIFAPPGPITQNNAQFGGVWVVESQDPASIVQSYHDYLVTLDELEMEGFSYTTQVDLAAHEVADHSIDRYVIKVDANGPPPSEIDPIIQDQRGAIFQTDDAVVIAFNRDETQLVQAVMAADGSGSGSLQRDPGIAGLRKHLPQQAVGQMFINVGPILESIPGVRPARQGTLPPIAVGAGIHNGAIGVRGFVPMQVVVSIKNAATQAMMNMASGVDPFANVR